MIDLLIWKNGINPVAVKIVMYARSTKEYVNANIQGTEDVRYYKKLL